MVLSVIFCDGCVLRDFLSPDLYHFPNIKRLDFGGPPLKLVTCFMGISDFIQHSFRFELIELGLYFFGKGMTLAALGANIADIVFVESGHQGHDIGDSLPALFEVLTFVRVV